jgi:hypothetical protein
MITPAHLAKNLDIGSIAESSQVVRLVNFIHDKADGQIDHVRITEANRYSWPSESVLTIPMELELDKSIKGGAEVGDVIWLSRRKKIPEVSILYLLFGQH